MTSREIAIYFALIYKGDWKKIYHAIYNHEEIDEKEAKKLLKKINSKVVTIFDDDDYPQQLKATKRPPFVLFYHGDLSIIKDKRKAISVVGSRDYSDYGLNVTMNLVKELSKDLVIVSGMARGIDGIAQQTCIDNGGKTVAVLGCGVNVCYPPSNLQLYEQIRENHLIISEYPDLTEPCPTNFPIRNRIIAALSGCLLVTEGRKYSGTSITAGIALECGNEVCCVPTHIGLDSVCNHLIASGAYLVETVQDIYDVMGYRKQEPIFEK